MKKRVLGLLVSMTMVFVALSSENAVYAASDEDAIPVTEDVDTDEITLSLYEENISTSMEESPALEDPELYTDRAPGDDLEENGIYGFVNDDGVSCTISGCSSDLTELNLPDALEGYTVTEIMGSAFNQMSQLTGTLTIPAGVVKIGERAFFGCIGITELEYADDCRLKEIGKAAFYGCSGLQGEFSIPETVTSIGAQAFCKDDGFDGGTLKLPSKLETLGFGAFTESAKFTGTLIIPDSLKNADDGALDGLYGINTFINRSSCSFPAIYVIDVKDAYGQLVSSDGKERLSRSSGSIEKGTYYRCFAKLDKPMITSVENLSKGVKIKWKKTDGANAYYISRNGWKEEKLLGNVSSYTDKTAQNGKTYTYKVKAYSDLTRSQSDWSSKEKMIFLEAPQKPQVKNNSKGTIKVNWKQNKKCSGYEVQYGLSSSFKDAVIKNVNKNSKKSLTIKKLKKNKTYYVRVRSYKKSGNKYYSAWSNKVKIKIKK
ncbi:MAG: fibronectin type III domain-containing protein [Lachnospiraceae bacterium]|nr:fibronectin type III domain-containing protein [Lachnospiraceae bacterium]